MSAHPEREDERRVRRCQTAIFVVCVALIAAVCSVVGRMIKNEARRQGRALDLVLRSGDRINVGAGVRSIVIGLCDMGHPCIGTCFIEYCDGGIEIDQGHLCRALQQMEEQRKKEWRRTNP